MAHDGFDELTRISEGREAVVYRARRKADGERVVLKVLRGPRPGPESLERFRREHELTTLVRGPGVVDCIDLLSGAEPTLVLGDTGARSLDREVADGPLDPADVLRVGIATADALCRVHDAGVMHQDIAPANVLWSAEQGSVQLIDFGSATRTRQLATTAATRRDVVGTLAYMAPEQSGRMNRSVDTRADLYALGATLYHLATGRPPFVEAEPLNLIHAHIARTPPSAAEIAPAVPASLSAILDRLLAKSADDRYQTAAGVRADLAQALDQHGRGDNSSFELGARDVLDALRLPDGIYGRAAALASLEAAFARSSTGRCEMLLVAGVSGIGKTRLVNEIGPEMLERRATLITGKHDQFQRGTPYAALVAALERFVGDVLSGSDADVNRWRAAIVEAAGVQLPVLVDVVPDLALLVGDQPEPDRLPPTEAEARFAFLVRRVVRALASEQHPLVLFLDDLQWADHSSMNLVQSLVTDPQAHNVLIIGAYRDNEVEAGHPLRSLVDDIESRGGHVTHVHLGPLDEPDVRAYVADALDSSPEAVGELATLLRRKSNGNPFFLERLLDSMANDRVIHRTDDQAWTWDMAAAAAVAPTDNVIDLLSVALGSLEPDTQQALGLGALLGERFELRTLADIGDWSLSATARSLESALLAAMISRVDDSVALESRMEDDLDESIRPTYRFAHDRVQQAARGLLSPVEIDDAHIRIAQFLRASEPEGGEIFDLVEHVLSASSRVPPADRTAFAGLSTRAGEQASAAAAFPPALRYFSGAWDLLGPEPWSSDHDLAKQIALGGAEAAYLVGDQHRVDQWTNEVTEHCTDIVSVLRAEEIAIQALNARNELVPAIERAVAALRLAGVKLPADPSQASVLRGLLGVKQALRTHDIESLAALPDCDDEIVLAALRIQMRISVSAYYARPDLLPLLAFNMVRATLRHGVAAESPFGFCVYGLVLCALGQIDNGLEAGDVAVLLNERSDDNRLRYRANHLYNTHLRQWRDHWRLSRDDLRENHRACWDGGDLVYAAFGAFMSTTMTVYLGDPLEDVVRIAGDFAEAISGLQNDTSLQTLQMNRQLALCLSGQAPDPTLLRGEAYDESMMRAVHEEAGDETNLFLRSLYGAHLALLFGDTARAVAMLDEADSHKNAAASTVYSVMYEFLVGVANAAESADEGRAGPHRRRTRRSLRRLQKWSSHSMANVDHRVALIEAELAAASGKDAEAIEHFEQAIRRARTNEWHADVALASERAARFHLDRNHAAIGRGHLLDCRHHYEAWGAVAKVSALDVEFADELRGAAGSPVASLSPTMTSLDPVRSLDAEALIDASAAISTERQVAGVVEALLRLSVEVGGATRGALVMREPNGFAVRAVATADMVEEVHATDVGNLDGAGVVGAAVLYAARTLETVVVGDAPSDGRYRTDPHVVDAGVRSVLALPVVQQQRLVAVLYLENDLTPDAFPDERVATLRALAGQAAVSLHNAQLYESLEQQVRDRTGELVAARREAETQRDRADSLLVNVLPESIAEELKRTGSARPVSVPEATVLFTDFKGFTAVAETMSPEELVSELARVFTAFDRIVDAHGIEKLKTIGDAYMAVGGVPIYRPTHAVDAVRAALDMAAFVERGDDENEPPPFEVRIGLHSGPLVAGVIGERRFLYDVWGDTVNVASRMESSSAPGRVNISAATHALVAEHFECTPRGRVEAKGKGDLEMWFVEG